MTGDLQVLIVLLIKALRLLADLLEHVFAPPATGGSVANSDKIGERDGISTRR